MNELEKTAEQIQEMMEEINTARDTAYQRSRKLIALCAKTIRAIHREEWDRADKLLGDAKSAAQQMIDDVSMYPNLYWAGYTQDALKEFVEAHLTYALIRDRPLPRPETLNVEPSTWLNGLAEAATELRRRILDIIRHGYNEEAERLLDHMDQIYSTLVTIDFSDAITGGLRRRTDTVRAVLERTRGDVTNSIRQSELEQALKKLEAKLS